MDGGGVGSGCGLRGEFGDGGIGGGDRPGGMVEARGGTYGDGGDGEFLGGFADGG